MFGERQNFNSRKCKAAEKCCQKGDVVRKFNNNVGDVPPQLNTMPPPPHKLVGSGKNALPVSCNRREYWRSNYTNGRSLSPLGYDSDESCKSFGSKGNSTEEHGKHFLWGVGCTGKWSYF